MKLLSVFIADFRQCLSRFPLILLVMATLVTSILLSLPQSLLKVGKDSVYAITLACDEKNETVRYFLLFAAEYPIFDHLQIKTAAQAEQLLENGQTDIVIEIQDNLMETIATGEPATIRIRAKDAFIGTFVYTLSTSIANAASQVQAEMKQFYDPANLSEHMDSESIQLKADTLLKRLLKEAVFRNYAVSSELETYRYFQLQAISLLLFLVVSVSAIFEALLSARQLSDGYLRRIRMNGISPIMVIGTKTAVCMLLSTFLALLLIIPLRLSGIEIFLPRLMVSALLLSLIVFPPCATLVFSHKGSAAVSNTFLACVALLLLLLFSGGGIYPIHLMEHSFKWCNPMWLSNLLSVWSTSGTVPSLVSIVLFFIPAILSFSFVALKWRKLPS